jgi:predicted DNA-binding protein (MmcQ/YjbR family)
MQENPLIVKDDPLQEYYRRRRSNWPRPRRHISWRYHLLMPDVDWIRKLCLSFPDVTEDMPWGDDLCFKIRGKIFAGMVLSDGRFPRITLKSSPENFHDLLETEGITPAPYVGRYKWIQLVSSNLLPANDLESLIRQSYELVAAKAPKAKKRKRTSAKPPKKKKTRKKKSTRGV